MGTFVLPPNRTISLNLNAAAIQRVREAHGVDLVGNDGREFLKLANDPCLLVDVMWTIIEPQAASLGLNAEQFGAALVGDGIEAATDALLQSILDFLPPKRRNLISTAVEREREIEQQALEKTLAALNSPELERRALADLDDRIARVLSGGVLATIPDSLSKRLIASPSTN